MVNIDGDIASYPRPYDYIRSKSNKDGKDIEFIDSLFLKAFVNTDFGRKYHSDGRLDDPEENKKLKGAERLYIEARIQFFQYKYVPWFFGISDFRKAEGFLSKKTSELERATLPKPTRTAVQKLPKSLDYGLLNIIEKEGNSELYKEGAFELYTRVVDLL